MHCKSNLENVLQMLIGQSSFWKKGPENTQSCEENNLTTSFYVLGQPVFLSFTPEEVLCVLAVMVVPQKTVGDVETHVRRFAVDRVWPS